MAGATRSAHPGAARKRLDAARIPLQGKNSSSTKQRRLLSELQSHAQLSGTCCANRRALQSTACRTARQAVARLTLRAFRSSVREEYMPAMRLALTAPMWSAAAGGREKDGIEQVMELMNDYSLTRCARAGTRDGGVRRR